MPRSAMVGYQHFRGPCCLHLQSEAAWASEMLVSNHDTTWHHNPEDQFESSLPQKSQTSHNCSFIPPPYLTFFLSLWFQVANYIQDHLNYNITKTMQIISHLHTFHFLHDAIHDQLPHILYFIHSWSLLQHQWRMLLHRNCSVICIAVNDFQQMLLWSFLSSSHIPPHNLLH